MVTLKLEDELARQGVSAKNCRFQFPELSSVQLRDRPRLLVSHLRCKLRVSRAVDRCLQTTLWVYSCLANFLYYAEKKKAGEDSKHGIC